MTAHHLINEGDLAGQCLYCSRKLTPEKWKSQFHYWKHYKVMKCACGRENKIRVHFHGSGHDTWSQNIEDKV